MRGVSTPLFTAILASSSSFLRKDLRSDLLNHGQTLFNRATAAGLSDVGLIQSIIINTYWKAATDRSGWLRIGVAIRMAFQLRWHHSWRAELPLDSMEARKVLDSERTWFCKSTLGADGFS